MCVSSLLILNVYIVLSIYPSYEILNSNMIVKRFMGAGTAYPACFIGGEN
jgi:hypothetical protein